MAKGLNKRIHNDYIDKVFEEIYHDSGWRKRLHEMNIGVEIEISLLTALILPEKVRTLILPDNLRYLISKKSFSLSNKTTEIRIWAKDYKSVKRSFHVNLDI